MFSFKTFAFAATAAAILSAGLIQPSSAASPPGLSSAQKVAAEDGSAAVIVELRPEQVGVSLSLSTSDFVRRSTVARAADLFISRVIGSANAARQRGVRQATNLPVVAFNATSEDLARMASDPLVERVHLDATKKRTLTESTAIIGMPTVWAAGGDGGNTVVVVLDTGVASSHPFLSGKVVAEACFSRSQTSGGYTSVSVCPNGQNSQTGTGSGVNCNVALYGSGCEHGTHVAGIAAGANPALTPAYGVAKGSSIFAVQVFSYFPAFSDVLSWSSDQILALDHVYSQRNSLAPKRIVSVNMSLGGGSYSSTCPSDPLRPAVQLLRSVGIAVVAAAGNDGFVNAMGAPACIPEVVSVGSTTKSDQISSFSNISAQTTLLAPGSNIVSSVPGNGFKSFNGTSMATPHVAGALAAMADGVPSMSVDQLIAALVSTGLPIADVVHTKNRIQVAAAYQSLAPQAPELVVTPTSAVVIKHVGSAVTPSKFTVKVRSTTGTVNWSVSGVPSWLKASVSSGTVNTTGTSVTFTVIPPAGQTSDLNGTLTFRKVASTSPGTKIPVKLDFVPQELKLKALTPTTIRWTPTKKPNPSVIKIKVSANVGIAKWKLTGVPGWLKPSATSGSVGTGGQVISFRVAAPKGKTKALTGKIKFAIPGVAGSTEIVSVKLNARKAVKKSGGSAIEQITFE